MEELTRRAQRKEPRIGGHCFDPPAQVLEGAVGAHLLIRSNHHKEGAEARIPNRRRSSAGNTSHSWM